MCHSKGVSFSSSFSIWICRLKIYTHGSLPLYDHWQEKVAYKISQTSKKEDPDSEQQPPYWLNPKNQSCLDLQWVSQFFVGLVVPENLSTKSLPNTDTHTDKQTDTCTYIHIYTDTTYRCWQRERERDRQTYTYRHRQMDTHIQKHNKRKPETPKLETAVRLYHLGYTGTDHAKATRPHETEQKLTSMGQEEKILPCPSLLPGPKT